MSEEKVVTVRMSEALHGELKAYCISASRSMNGEVTALIQAKLSMIEPKERDIDVSTGYGTNAQVSSSDEPRSVGGFQGQNDGSGT